MEASELREMGVQELLKKLQDAQQELFTLRLRIAGQSPNTAKIRALRRDVARVKAVLLEKDVRV